MCVCQGCRQEGYARLTFAVLAVTSCGRQARVVDPCVQFQSYALAIAMDALAKLHMDHQCWSRDSM